MFGFEHRSHPALANRFENFVSRVILQILRDGYRRRSLGARVTLQVRAARASDSKVSRADPQVVHNSQSTQ